MNNQSNNTPITNKNNIPVNESLEHTMKDLEQKGKAFSIELLNEKNNTNDNNNNTSKIVETMKKGSNEFEKRLASVGNRMTYMEMRSMWG